MIVTQRERRQSRDDAREARRRLAIEWADKFWLAQHHPVDDAILAWLSEHRADASKLGASRWNLETLPGLVERQSQLRKAAAFQTVLDRATISHQTLTAEAVLKAGGFPQNQTGENQNAAPVAKRPKRKDAGIARPFRKQATNTNGDKLCSSSIAPITGN